MICNRCDCDKPETLFHWQVVAGKQVRDKTCKQCRTDQQRDRRRRQRLEDRHCIGTLPGLNRLALVFARLPRAD